MTTRPFALWASRHQLANLLQCSSLALCRFESRRVVAALSLHLLQLLKVALHDGGDGQVREVRGQGDVGVGEEGLDLGRALVDDSQLVE